MAYSITPTEPDLDNAQVGTANTTTLANECSAGLHAAYARIATNVTSQHWPDGTMSSNGAKALRCRWALPVPSDGPREVTLRVRGKNATGTGGVVHFESYATLAGAATDTGTAAFNGVVGATQSSDITIDLPEGQDEAYVRIYLQSTSDNVANDVEVYSAGIWVEPLTSVVAVGNGGVRIHGGGTFAPCRTATDDYPYDAAEIHARVRTARSLLRIPRIIDAWSGVDDSRNGDIDTPRPRTATRRDARVAIVPPPVYYPIPGVTDGAIQLRYFVTGGASDVTIRPYAITIDGTQRLNTSATVSVSAAAAGAWYSTTIPLPASIGAPLPPLRVNLGLDALDSADAAVSSYSCWAV